MSQASVEIEIHQRRWSAIKQQLDARLTGRSGDVYGLTRKLVDQIEESEELDSQMSEDQRRDCWSRRWITFAADRSKDPLITDLVNGIPLV